MAYKKSILEKFQDDSESSDCRSPRHDWRNWYIPATSSSDENPKNQTSEEDPGVEVTHSTSRQGGQGISPSSNIQSTTLRIAHLAPPKKRFWGNFPSTDSSSSWRNFKTDDSPVSTSNSTNNSKSSTATVPFLGTAAHPITASSTSSSDGGGGFETGPSGKSTEVFSNNQDTSTDSEKTVIVTSTPLKSDPPPPEKI